MRSCIHLSLRIYLYMCFGLVEQSQRGVTTTVWSQRDESLQSLQTQTQMGSAKNARKPKRQPRTHTHPGKTTSNLPCLCGFVVLRQTKHLTIKDNTTVTHPHMWLTIFYKLHFRKCLRVFPCWNRRKLENFHISAVGGLWGHADVLSAFCESMCMNMDDRISERLYNCVIEAFQP